MSSSPGANPASPTGHADGSIATRIASDPRYLALVRSRQRFSWTLTAITVVIYSAFISLIAFDKPFMARSIGGGVTSIGVVLGLLMLFGTVAICAVYVRRANTVYDAAIADLLAGPQS